MSTWCDAAACRVLGRCVAAVLPRDHPRFPGALTCVARDESACKASQACTVEGRCRLDPATSACVPGDHDDCARSTLCTERQLCRRVIGPMGASCGGTTPETSGIDTIGFIDNPALGLRKAVLDVQSETIDGPLAEIMVGLSKSQLADVTSIQPRFFGSRRSDRVLSGAWMQSTRCSERVHGAWPRARPPRRLRRLRRGAHVR